VEKNDTIARTMHDLGLGAWFGGSLMGALAIERAAAAASDPQERIQIVNEAWRSWQPVQAAAIGAFALGGVLITIGNRGRLGAQRGVGRTSLIKTAVAAVTVGATMYARRLGSQLSEYDDVPVESGNTPSEETPEEVASIQRRLKVVQWAVPAHVAALIAVSAKMGEQQRPQNVIQGIWQRVRPEAA
jgi:hypothetical protein